MSEIRRIRDQLRRAQEGEAWHGPSVREVLAGVTAEQAASRPVAGAHSIWELVRHIAAWERFARERITDWKVHEVPVEQDWPPVTDTSEAAWTAALDELVRGHGALLEAISSLDEEMLDQIIEGAPYSAYFLLHGVIQHDLYHAGQIAVLKKAG